MKPSLCKIQLSRFSLLLFCFCSMLVLSVVSHAEGHCPPGYYEAGGGCAPRPDNDQGQMQSPQRQAPAIQWADQWGAIATDFSHNSAGVSENMSDRDAAEQGALTECRSKGGQQCKVEISYRNQCVALLVGPTGHNAKSGLTIDAAVQSATKICTDAGENHCRAYYTACSYPKRIQ